MICISQGTGATLEGVSLELMLLDWDRVTKNEVRKMRRNFRVILSVFSEK